jgi:uncharacterized protein YlxW (UPF0749 family)
MSTIVMPECSFLNSVCVHATDCNERRREEEAKMARKLAAREEAALMKEQEYATLDQEVKEKQKKLKRIQKRLQVRRCT